MTLLRHMGCDVHPAAGDWLLGRCRPCGGFETIPGAPAPDLLATATALHALSRIGVPLDDIRGRCLDFVNSLRDGDGGYRATEADETGDCEYAFYALLAMGHLRE